MVRGKKKRIDGLFRRQACRVHVSKGGLLTPGVYGAGTAGIAVVRAVKTEGIRGHYWRMFSCS